jgi:hypothetical protein
VFVATVVEAALSLAETLAVQPEKVALGGRLMGGRMCSMAVAEGLGAAALVLVSYPVVSENPIAPLCRGFPESGAVGASSCSWISPPSWSRRRTRRGSGAGWTR